MNIDARVLRSDLDRLDPALVDAVLADVLARAAAKMANRARGNAPKATSTLAQSIRPRRLSSRQWEVAAGQRYAAGLEAGGGHRGESLDAKRLSALEAWVKAKNIETDPIRIARAAWNIGKAVEERGVEAQPFMAPALDEVSPEVLPDLKRAILEKL